MKILEMLGAYCALCLAGFFGLASAMPPLTPPPAVVLQVASDIKTPQAVVSSPAAQLEQVQRHIDDVAARVAALKQETDEDGEITGERRRGER